MIVTIKIPLIGQFELTGLEGHRKKDLTLPRHLLYYIS